ncbi:uncharacterized protein K452DRAFT_358433 [Aplosporella prunicola CBS 121167]|uniref:SGNH hydrolase-type esterase domain-containing protein n=1 Tax=Aplosporella prunicola CBS 121167 TaxID=1176127 RepID=A0A6A6BCJ1_9PEZI|nr:uncharacterized protein K452DRAFT_358433 [Aplosporella prunicola CBS 121167]KAF2141932.1 hypothetical protein K452DRAFT_358433 [Aplosporella prunicola CBS 121167]
MATSSIPLLLILLTLFLPTPTHAHNSTHHFIATWTASPQLTEPANLPPHPFNFTNQSTTNDSNSSNTVLFNATLRQTVRLTLSARTLRLRISNAFGTETLRLTRVTIALPKPSVSNGNSNSTSNNTGTASGSSAIDTRTLRAVTFDGGEGTSIPSGAQAVSDPADIGGLDVGPGAALAVNLYLRSGVSGGAVTGHPGSRTRSWVARGDGVGMADLRDGDEAKEAQHWYLLSGIEALAPRRQRTLAVLGDSLTDGRGSVTDTDTRWTDLLFSRLQASANTSAATSSSGLRDISVANLGLGGNRVLGDGLGPSMLARVERDVLAQPGVRWAVIWGGINDIGTAAAEASAQAAVGAALKAGYAQLVARMRGAGIVVVGGTLTAFGAPAGTEGTQPYWDAGGERERTRQDVNAWVRGSGVFDGVVDFDALVRDPRNESLLRTEFDSGDFLHLNARGYRALAEGFDLRLLERGGRGGGCG